MNARPTPPGVFAETEAVDATVPGSLSRRGLSRQGRERLVGIASPLVFLLLWELAARFGVIDARFFPAPSDVAVTFVEMVSAGELQEHFGVSIKRLFLGIAIGGVPGLVLGLIMGLNRYIRVAIDPLIATTYPIPKSAIFPLFLLIFGIGDASKVAIVAVGVFFPLAINTTAGVLEIAPIYRDVGRNFGASRWQTFSTIALPGALPLILTGVKLAIGMALMLIVVAEMLGANSGLGYLVWNSWQLFAVERMFVGLAVIAFLGFALTLVVKEVGARLVPWKAD